MTAIDWQFVARRRMHPVAAAVLDHLAQVEQASPKAIAEEIGEPLNNVAYHARTLREHGCLELVGTAKRRDADEHFYRLSEEARAEGPHVVVATELQATGRAKALPRCPCGERLLEATEDGLCGFCREEQQLGAVA